MLLKYLLLLCMVMVACHSSIIPSHYDDSSIERFIADEADKADFLASETLKEEWNNFKIKYNRSYSSPAAEVKRMRIFAENTKFILEHNDRYEKAVETYSVKMNWFGDLSLEEWQAQYEPPRNENSKVPLNETSKNDEEPYDYGATFIVPAEVKIPKHKDWRNVGAVTRVKDQGACGSCWAFSAIGALEGQNFLKTGHLVELSEQNLIDCSLSNDGCNGGTQDSAFIDIKKIGGVNTEKSYPTEKKKIKKGECRYKEEYNGATVYGYVTIPNDELKLQAAVATIGPISISISSTGNGFRFYDKGVYFEANGTETYDTDHAMLLVGYGVADVGEYWIAKNSWGTEWGEKGYMRIARNRDNQVNIAYDATYPLV